MNESKAREDALATSNRALKDQAAATEARLHQTKYALRVAGKNAEQARADAEAAEVTAATLAQTLQSLQTVVEETKLASGKLLDDQQEVAAMAQQAESKLLQRESELAQLKKEMESIRQSSMLLEHARDEWKMERKTLESNMKTYQEQYEKIKREHMEQTEIEAARKERADKVEADYRTTQALLAEVATEQQGAKETIEKLRKHIESLQRENSDTHKKLSEQQQSSSKTHTDLSSSLSKAELELQQLRIQNEAAKEEMERLKHEKEQAIQHLRNRVIRAEREVMEKAVASETKSAAATHVTPQPPRAKPRTSFNIAPLPGSAAKVNKEAINKGEVCCICLKAISGLSKGCSCGKCQHKAHIMCVKNIAAPPSLSHPGTPAAPRPVVLCKLGVGARAQQDMS